MMMMMMLTLKTKRNKAKTKAKGTPKLEQTPAATVMKHDGIFQGLLEDVEDCDDDEIEGCVCLSERCVILMHCVSS